MGGSLYIYYILYAEHYIYIFRFLYKEQRLYTTLYIRDTVKRTDNNARFAAEFTDDVLLAAVVKALETPSVQASEVADIVGCNPLYAKRRLQDMADRGLIEGKIIGNVWCCRLKE
jgi:hypothetical protein